MAQTIDTDLIII